jgi:hypothetical protein
MNYEALIMMSAAVWRIIAAIREPVLHPIRQQLIKYAPQFGERLFKVSVWLIAFVLGYGYATMSGEGGDMLNALGWTDGYLQAGQAMTALAIACGSAGLRVVEKLFEAKGNA